MISLITTIYPIKSPQRLDEIVACLDKNVANPLVDRVHVFVEGDCASYDFLCHPKIEQVSIDSRPTYLQFFTYASNRLTGKTVAVCNSDVYFDETLVQADRIGLEEMWCLCRYNILPDGRFELQGDGMRSSADAWLFRSPLKEFASDIKIGVRGCDSYLAQKAREAGIRLKNPCGDLVLRHLHRDAERNDTPDGLSYWDAPDYAPRCVPPLRLGRVK